MYIYIYKPSFATVAGWGVDPMCNAMLKQTCGKNNGKQTHPQWPQWWYTFSNPFYCKREQLKKRNKRIQNKAINTSPKRMGPNTTVRKHQGTQVVCLIWHRVIIPFNYIRTVRNHYKDRGAMVFSIATPRNQPNFHSWVPQGAGSWNKHGQHRLLLV